jgi:hypothetical protein
MILYYMIREKAGVRGLVGLDGEFLPRLEKFQGYLRLSSATDLKLFIKEPPGAANEIH